MGATRGYRNLPRVTRGYRGLQEVTGGNKWVIGGRSAYTELQEVTEC